MHTGAVAIVMFRMVILEPFSAWILPCVGSETQQKDWSRSKVLELVVLACVGGHPELVDEKKERLEYTAVRPDTFYSDILSQLTHATWC
jgi:hypothetical protein